MAILVGWAGASSRFISKEISYRCKHSCSQKGRGEGEGQAQTHRARSNSARQDRARSRRRGS